MKITYFGHSHFLFEGKDYSLMLDPFSNIGLKENKANCDYFFCSHSHYDHSNFSLAIGANKVGNQPFFKVVKSFHDEKGGALRGENNILIFEMDGKRIAFLGDLGEGCNDRLIAELNGVDLMLIPVGGNYTIDGDTAYEYFVKSNAKAVIPMHYYKKGSTVDIDTAKTFLKNFDSYKELPNPFDYNGESGVLYFGE